MSATEDSKDREAWERVERILREVNGFNGPRWAYSHIFGPTGWSVAGVSVPIARVAEPKLPPIDDLNFSIERVGRGMLQIRLERIDSEEGLRTVLGSTAIPIEALLRVARQDAATPGEREDLHSSMCQAYHGNWPPIA
ncbi:hypothetical protein ACRAWG_21620 [Methylobacterium sp. P31]